MKCVRGTYDVEVMICSVCVYTLHVIVNEGCIFVREKENRVYICEREGKFDTPPKIDDVSILCMN